MFDHEKFLSPEKSSSELWNEQHKANVEFFQAQDYPFLPHTEGGMVPDEVLYEFTNERADTFLAAARLMSKMKSSDRVGGAEEVVQRLAVL